jgi:hypothetical protein
MAVFGAVVDQLVGLERTKLNLTADKIKMTGCAAGAHAVLTVSPVKRSSPTRTMALYYISTAHKVHIWNALFLC